jgi:lipopolysaccharide transport protein LptA
MAVLRPIDPTHAVVRRILALPLLLALPALSGMPVTAAAAGPALKVGRDSDQPIALDAASSEVDYHSNTVVFRNIVITQGTTRVVAERANASGLNFVSSQWTFTGAVRINVEGGSLDSDKAVVSFVDNRVSKAVITGAPATFQQQLKSDGRLARGRAGMIEYDLGKGTVRLTRDAWLSDGRDEMTGQQIVYDIAGERVKAQTVAHDAQRVRITIVPRADTSAPGAPVNGNGSAPARVPSPTPGAAPNTTPGAAPNTAPGAAPTAAPGTAPPAPPSAPPAP